METKNNAVINIRLPEEMKAQLKQRFGYNMSKILKEHFQQLIDRYDYEKKNKCFLCKSQKDYDECSYAPHSFDDEVILFIFCKGCLVNTMEEYEQVPDILFIKEMQQRARDDNMTTSLKDIGDDITRDPKKFELGEGTISFKIPEKSEIENEETPESIHPHKQETRNIS